MAVDVRDARSTTRADRPKRPWGAIVLFIGPVMVVYLIFIAYPLLATLYYSFHEIVPSGGEIVINFVGLKNYIELLSDDIFVQHAVPNTLLWAVVGPTIEMIMALSLAFLLYFKVPLHRLFRTAWFLPRLVSGVIVGLVFRWIFNVDWGLLNATLRFVGLDALALNWLGRTDTPIWIVILVHNWSVFGYSMILLLAGLTAIPEELIEAAYIDGANTLQAIWKVMIPILRPTLVTVVTLSFMGKMRAFNVVWVLTQGRPMHHSETVATYVQKRAFGWGSLDLGYPSAMSILWFGVILLSVGLLTRLMRRRARY